MIGSLTFFPCPPAVAETAQAAASSGGAQDALGAAVAVAFMGATSLVYFVKRGVAVRRTFETSRRKVDADRELLRAAAQRQRTRTLLAMVACLAAVAAIAAAPLGGDIRLALAVTPSLLLAVSLATAWRVQRVLSASNDRAIRVVSHGEFLFAARGTQLVGWLAVPPRAVAAAIALPVAQLRR